MWWPSSVTLTVALESECSPSVLVTLLTWKIRCLFRSMRRSVTCSDCSEPCAHKSEADMDKHARTHTLVFVPKNAHTHTCVCSEVPPSARLKPSSLTGLQHHTIDYTWFQSSNHRSTSASLNECHSKFSVWKTWSVATVSSSQAEAAMLNEWEMGWLWTKPSKYIMVHNCWWQKILAAANDAVIYFTCERSKCMLVKKHKFLGERGKGLELSV